LLKNQKKTVKVVEESESESEEVATKKVAPVKTVKPVADEIVEEKPTEEVKQAPAASNKLFEIVVKNLSFKCTDDEIG